MPKKTPAPLTQEDKLDQILLHLRRLDNRDRLRTWGAFVRGILGLIPLVILLLSAWYVYKNGDVLLKNIAAEAAKQTAIYTNTTSGNALKQLQDLLK